MIIASTRSRSRRVALTAAACLVVFAVGGCSDSTPTETPDAEVAGGAIGPDESVSADLKVLQVQLAYPIDGVHQVGDDASLYLAVSNTSSDPDALVDVSATDATDVQAIGPAGEAGLPFDIPADGNVYIGVEGGPSLTLVGLTRELHSSESTSVTFTFADAGTVTVDAMVAAEGQSPAPTYDFPAPDTSPSHTGGS